MKNKKNVRIDLNALRGKARRDFLWETFKNADLNRVMELLNIFTAEQIREAIALAVEAAGGVEIIAEKMGVSTQELQAIISGDVLPYGKVLEGVGFEQATYYRRTSAKPKGKRFRGMRRI